MRLFQEELWLESYNHYASRLKENPLTFDEMAACILFLNPQVPFEGSETLRIETFREFSRILGLL